MTGPATDDEFDRITSSAHLGSLLRRLRGSRTQQNIADHAKRHNFYVHRPNLSGIERGHRLPTSNELRGILHGCGRIDLFGELDGIRQQLMAESADPPFPTGRLHQVSHLPAAPPGTADEADLGSPDSGHDGARRKLVIAVLLVAVVAIITTMILTSRAPPTRLDPPAAIAAARESPLCAEGIVPDAGVASTVLAQDPGPADAVTPNRLVELHAYHDPQHGWIAWAHLATSASSRDRLWLDWSYLPEPTERNQWRQCGPHPISSGPDSPAVKAVDSSRRERWFRACGQAPPEDRPPGSERKSFCTSWVPVLPE